MPYCVNCGVELAESEKKCPLCSIPVYVPNQNGLKKFKTPYPAREEYFSNKRERRFTSLILTLCFSFPALICFLVDLIYSSNLWWSFFVVGAMVILWVFTVPPLIIENLNLFVCIALDSVAVILYLYLVEYLTKGDWFFWLGLPLALTLTILIIICGILVFYRYVWGFYVGALLSVAVGIFVAVLESVISNYHFGHMSFNASLIVGIVMFFSALFFLSIGRRQKLKEEFKKRMHM